MDISFTVTSQVHIAALTRALQAYNSRNPATELSASAFLQTLLVGQLDNLAQNYVTTTLTRGEFLQRFTAAERVAIRDAAKTNGYVQDYLELLAAHESVHLDNPLVAQGIALLVTAGLLTQARADEILAI